MIGALIRRDLRLALTCLLLPVAGNAQAFTLGVRGTGSVPTGTFADASSATNGAVIAGAKNGFGFGLDVGVSIGLAGLYAGFDHISFDCADTQCATSGSYRLQGVTAGVRLMPQTVARLKPYVQGGVTFNSLEGTYGSSSRAQLTTDRAPGFELGAGVAYTLGGLVSIAPQLRYVGQSLKAKIPGVTVTNSAPSSSVQYLTFDLGLRVVSPFGAKR